MNGARGFLIALVTCACTYTVRQFSGAAAPATLTYAETPVIYHRNLAIVPNPATSGGGAPTEFSISPDLPPGLIIDAHNGTISGTPSAAAAASNYTVTASNAAGSTQTTLNIWVTDTPPALVFADPPYTFIVGSSSATVVPINTGGPIQACSAAPALPPGLFPGATTCAIAGTPTQAAPLANYTLTASYPGGSATVTVALQVANALALFPPTVTLRALPTAPFQFTVNGGVPPFSFTKTGPGSIDAQGVFTPPAARALSTVSVTDAVGEVASATITSVVTLVDGPVEAFTASSSSVYLGGLFAFANPFPSPSLVAVDPLSGAPQPAFDTQQSFDGTVNGLVVDASWVYAVGAFETYRQQAARGLVKLDLLTGAPDSAFLTGSGFDLPPSVIAEDANAIYVGGGFSSYNGEPAFGLAKIDKATGSLAPGFASPLPPGDQVSAMAIDGSQVFVVDSTVLLRLDALSGQALSFAAPLPATSPAALAVAPDGLFVIDSALPSYKLDKLDKSSGLPVQGFTSQAFQAAPFTIVFDGTSLWEAGQDNQLSAGNVEIGHLAQFDPVSGALLASVAGNDPLSELHDCMALVEFQDRIYVGGDFAAGNGLMAFSTTDLSPSTGFSPGGVNSVNINPSSGDGAPLAGICALGASAGTLLVGGQFAAFGGVAARNLAAFDRSTLTANATFAAAGGTDMGSDKDGVAALALGDPVLDPNALYVGGDFLHYGGECAPGLVKVNATNGSRITGFDAAATSLAGCASAGNSINVIVPVTWQSGGPLAAVAVAGFFTLASDAGASNLVVLGGSNGQVLQKNFPNSTTSLVGGLVAGDASAAQCLFYVSDSTLYEDGFDVAAGCLTGQNAATNVGYALAIGAGQVFYTTSNIGSPETVSYFSEADGPISTSFAAGTAAGEGINALVVVNEGQVAIAGLLTSYVSSSGLTLPAGNLVDFGGNPIWGGDFVAQSNDSINVIAPIDGQLFIGGNFTHYRNQPVFYAGFVDLLDGSLVR